MRDCVIIMSSVSVGSAVLSLGIIVATHYDNRSFRVRCSLYQHALASQLHTILHSITAYAIRWHENTTGICIDNTKTKSEGQ